MIYFEGVFLIIILGLQSHFFKRSKIEISALRNFFPNQKLNFEAVKEVEHQGHLMDQLDIQHSNKEFNKVVLATNAYLVRNKGSADFNIIKSIADRSVEAQENKVTSTLSLPLYLGLMGTFLGVILGLGSIALNGFDLQESDLMIKELVTGVVLAMMVSLFGLALTTILNAFLFKNAIADRDINRSHYFNFLQVELLPNLDNNLYSALDQFKSNIAEFNTKFSKNLVLFDSSFNQNIANLKGTVVGMATQIAAVNENTSVQLEFLRELKNIGYNRMAEANIKVFDKIKETGPLLLNFINEQKKLSGNLEQANAFTVKIGELLNRVSSFEEGINGLGRDLQQSDLLGADMLSLVKKHLSAINDKQTLVQDYASRSNNEVETYLTGALERIKVLKRKIEVDFENAFDFNAEDNLMQNLKHLKVIDENTRLLNKQFSAKNENGVEERLDELNKLIRELINRSERKNHTKSLRNSEHFDAPSVGKSRKWYYFGLKMEAK